MIRVALAVARHPRLWPIAIRQAWRTAPSGWWKRWPFAPVPRGEYLRFRLLTQYGKADAAPSPADVIAYLEWCRQWHHAA